jgi:hypothetical protein
MEEVRENFRLVEQLHHPHIAAVKTLERDPGTGDCRSRRLKPQSCAWRWSTSCPSAWPRCQTRRGRRWRVRWPSSAGDGSGVTVICQTWRASGSPAHGPRRRRAS